MDIRARMQLAANEADKALSGDVAPEPQLEKEDSAASDTDPDQEPDPDPQPNTDQDNTGLRAEVARLKAQLDDENNPTFKARWQSLQGMYNADTARLRAELDELKKTAEAKPAPAPITPFTDEDYATLVEEVGETAAKILKSHGKGNPAQNSIIAELKAEIATLKGETKAASDMAERVGKTQATTAAEQYATAQAKAIPDWDALMGTEDQQYANQNPKFTKFLQTTVRGKTNFDWLKECHTEGNLAGVKQIFDEGRIFAGAPSPAATKPKPSSGAEKYIEPDKTGKGAAVPAGQQEIIPHSEYNAFVNSVKKGTFRGTREERAQLEAKYDKAFAENRIR